MNININNVICVYYPNIEEPFDGINKLNLKPIENNRIKKLIETFEDNYTNFDYLSHVADLNTIKANKSVNNTNKPNSVSNGNAKSAPYHIPPQYNNQYNKNDNYNNPKRTAVQANSTKTASSISINRNVNNNNQSLPQPEASLKKNFQFKTGNTSLTNKPPITSPQTVPVPNLTSLNKEKTGASNQNTIRTNSALSDGKNLTPL